MILVYWWFQKFQPIPKKRFSQFGETSASRDKDKKNIQKPDLEYDKISLPIQRLNTYSRLWIWLMIEIWLQWYGIAYLPVFSSPSIPTGTTP